MLKHAFAVLALLTMALAAPAACEEAIPQNISFDDALSLSLKNNKSLAVQMFDPKISLTKETIEKAAFDPAISAEAGGSRNKSASGSIDNRSSESVELSQKLRGGGEVTIGLSSDDASSVNSARIGVSLSAPLLQGAGTDVNLAGVRQAALNTESSRLELRAFVESLVEQVSNAYWDMALAQREIKIYEDSLALAEQQLTETETMVDLGSLAEIEIVAARAETALREQALVNARSRLETLRVKMLRLMNADPASETELFVSDELVSPKDAAPDISLVADNAIKNRPDLLRARLAVERGDIEVVKTKNGLLPYLSFFVSLGGTGYSDSFGDAFGGMLSDAYDARAGLSYSAALGRAADKARFAAAELSLEQTRASLENMELLAREEAVNARLEVERARGQLAASEAALELQKEKLRAETEKFRIGKSTAIALQQAQRDHLRAEVDTVSAASDLLKARVSLLRAQGILLQSLSISIID
ncbi:MAG: outer membrane channel protein [bacterium ADurb.Bin236]|nr:MAG: outer membrane channel protein [bacterium ADurb.Bin236]